MAMRVARVEESLDFGMSAKYETRRAIYMLTRIAIQANALQKAEIHHLHGWEEDLLHLSQRLLLSRQP
jgi:hypothetical protein